jgi:threonine synthase
LSLLKSGHKPGQPINVVVPTGNFGNILAAYYAKQIGLPVSKFICASNENNVLADFMNSGVYDSNREFYLTSSPSMDILISSNLERLLWHLSGGRSRKVLGYMQELESSGKYAVNDRTKKRLNDFYGGSAEMKSVHRTIATLWNEEKYLIDTHTAVAYRVYLDYRAKSGDETPAVVTATASAYKFADRVAQTLGLKQKDDSFAYIDAINEETGVPVPEGLRNLKNRAITQKRLVTPDNIAAAVRERLAAKKSALNS